MRLVQMALAGIPPTSALTSMATLEAAEQVVVRRPARAGAAGGEGAVFRLGHPQHLQLVLLEVRHLQQAPQTLIIQMRVAVAVGEAAV